MRLYVVVVNRDDTVRVVSRNVVKETPMYYFLEKVDYHDLPTDEWGAFGYGERKDKGISHTSERSAVVAYMKRRQRDKENAKAVVAQTTKQIASANELLMHLPE